MDEVKALEVVRALADGVVFNYKLSITNYVQARFILNCNGQGCRAAKRLAMTGLVALGKL